MAVNGKVIQALVDTGSGHTLFRESTVKRMRGDIDLRHNPPQLQGVTGAPLRILGMWKAKVGVGDHKICERYFPVLPNSYLSCDALLGCDVLSQATLVWDGPKHAIVWGGTPYIVYHIRRWKKTVSRVQSCPVELDKPHQKFIQVSLKAPVQLDPYQTKFVPVTVPEMPGSTLLMYPQPRFCHHGHPFIVNVTSEQSIYVPLVNSTRKQKTFRKGTIVASYEEVQVPPPDNVNAT